MKRSKHALTILALAVVALFSAAPGAVAQPAIAPAAANAAPTLAMAPPNCRAGDNLPEIAAKFIGRCKKGSVRGEFPSDRLSRSLGEILAGKNAGNRDDVKAWKLLNDRRFDKP